MTDNDFASKVVVVTGGNSGIGRAVATEFARRDAVVVVAARRQESGEKAVAELTASGATACFVQADISRADDVKRLVDHCVSQLGGIDIAVNNAGVEGTPFVATADYEESVFDEVVGINLKGVWLCMKYQIPAMLARGGGAIVNMSSVAGLIGGRIGAAYFASKHGVIGLTKAAAYEYADQGIRINAVCPAAIKTEMIEREFSQVEGMEEAVMSRHPMGRIGTPEEVASAVMWLCSEGAGFVTGHSLVVDGGRLL